MSRRPNTIEEYATLQVRLLRGSREDVLRAHDLDEAGLTLVDAEFQEALSAAMEEEGDGVPPLLARYDAALRKARAEADAVGPAVLPLEEFVAITRALESGKDVAQVFERRNITFADYLRASEHWASRLATDPELATRFNLLRGG